MLTITIPKTELWNDEIEEFINFKGMTICLEHSLVSISKWEAKWKKPFLGRDDKTIEETIDYIRCMTLTQNVPAEAYLCLSSENIDAVNSYISDPMTATVVNDEKQTGAYETVTSELIYYWMVSLQIPVEFQKWHLNRLLTLIRVFNKKNTPPKKLSQSELMRRNSALNAARRKKLHSKG